MSSGLERSIGTLPGLCPAAEAQLDEEVTRRRFSIGRRALPLTRASKALSGRSGFLDLVADTDLASDAHDRAVAAHDRERAVQERKAAALLRAAAARDRAEAERQRQLAGIDELTGASLRGIGLAEITREIQRSQRTGTPLVLAFVDVNNLKAVNDQEGHLAGDALLRQVVTTLRTRLRAYDVIVRFGGDEFIYAVPNTNVESARQRLEEIIAVLEKSGLVRPISFGIAQLEQGDDLERLVRRADEALIDGRRNSPRRTRVEDAA